MAVTITFSNFTDLYNRERMTIDATVRQSHEMRNEVTEHPVEVGADITDHVRPKPRTLVIEGVVSATPIVAPGETPEPNRHIAAYHRFKHAAQKGEVLAIATGLEKYAPVVIESFVARREPKTGVDLYFTLTVKEVQTAETATTSAGKQAATPKSALGTGTPAQKRAVQDRVTPQKQRGLRQTKPATPSQQQAVSRAVANAKNKPAPRQKTIAADWYDRSTK